MKYVVFSVFIRSVLFFLVFFAIVQADVMKSLDISQAGMSVQQQLLQVLAENIANIGTAKNIDGTSYKIKKASVQTNKRTGKPFISKVEDSKTNMQRVYDPNNAESDAEGYVYIPEQSLSKQMVNLAEIKRLYEANAAVFATSKQLAQAVMNLGK